MTRQNTNGHKPTAFSLHNVPLFKTKYFTTKKMSVEKKRKTFGGYISQSPTKKHMTQLRAEKLSKD